MKNANNILFSFSCSKIERLRKEGSKLLEQEQEFLLEEIKKGHTEIPEEDEVENKTPKLKVINDAYCKCINFSMYQYKY